MVNVSFREKVFSVYPHVVEFNTNYTYYLQTHCKKSSQQKLTSTVWDEYHQMLSSGLLWCDIKSNMTAAIVT